MSTRTPTGLLIGSLPAVLHYMNIHILLKTSSNLLCC